jgi:hypothetical protein
MRWLDDVESDLKEMEVKGWKVVEIGCRGRQGSPRAIAPTGRQSGTRLYCAKHDE